MTQDEFLLVSLSSLQVITGVARTSWSQYFNGKRSPNVTSLTRMAGKLSMTPEQLLRAMEIRRAVTLKAKKCKKT